MTARTPPSVLQPASHTAEGISQLFQAIMAAEFGTSAFTGGVAPTNGGGGHGVAGLTDLAVTQNGTPSMHVLVAGGGVFVRGTETAHQGVMHGYNDAQVLLSLAAADEIDRLRAAVRHEADCVEACKSEIERLRAENAGLVDDMNLLRDNNTSLRAKIAEMEQQESVATVIKEGDSRYWMSERLWTFPDGKYPLYALHGAQAQLAQSMPEVTDAMALAFHHALTDGSIGAREVEEIKDALRAALAAAPKQEGE